MLIVDIKKFTQQLRTSGKSNMLKPNSADRPKVDTAFVTINQLETAKTRCWVASGLFVYAGPAASFGICYYLPRQARESSPHRRLPSLVIPRYLTEASNATLLFHITILYTDQQEPGRFLGDRFSPLRDQYPHHPNSAALTSTYIPEAHPGPLIAQSLLSFGSTLPTFLNSLSCRHDSHGTMHCRA